jgi:Cof subfamily protein (haloacid dehalogenase superfamily)
LNTIRHTTFRIVALDIDGTLLTDAHRLTDATKQAVHEAHARGAVIVLCTGRGPYNALPILEQLELEGTLITHNGAVTLRHPGKELIHQFEFQGSVVHPLIDYARRNHIHFDLCTAFEMFLDRCGAEAEAMYRQFMIEPGRIEDSKLLQHPIVKMTFFGRPEQMDQVEQDWAGLGVPLGMIRSGRRFIDVMSPRASKGEALRVLAEGWKVDQSEVLAIGNYYNDLEMLKFAGVGIAMENSPEKLKQEADDVTLSNNEDGVAAALRKYGLA